MSPDVLRVADVRTAVALALDAFESEQGSHIRIGHDHYWHLPVGTAFDLSREPSTLTVGQVSDDLNELQEINASGDAAPSWHGLAHVIGLLRLMEMAALPD
ncbi:hypothetical protein [Nocardioides daeguensis]|uniref:Uncharacterized protein n=1 Tax=Nocardioides daeguensis TaxID=908359 RepID=A0ABP6URZ0_9ACTN|nr:hypothetical protein [Nocardioides daeguensis]MBV6725534.1 hypothetical protein [Nocardioides daeguensis]MCR1771394.1 hypothetical protein [Nocardioides daeguensis]